MHRLIEPAIHYWGTPVVLVSTQNPDGSHNISPMSSAWWLGWSCMLGFDASSMTVANLRRRGQCVLNLASRDNAAAVNRLARTTGSKSVPLHKKALGYRHVADKAAHAALELLPAVDVDAARIAQCPVHLEAEVIAIRAFGEHDPRLSIAACSVEVRILRTHVDETLVSERDRIDARAWSPLLMSFRHLFARGDQLEESRLARGDEAQYAPWKQQGPRGWATRAALSLSRRRHRVGDPDEP